MIEMKLYKFWAPWCGPCATLSRHIKGVTIPEHLELVEINMDEEEGAALAKVYNVRAVPTMIICDASGKEISRFLGVKNMVTIQEWIDKNAN